MAGYHRPEEAREARPNRNPAVEALFDLPDSAAFDLLGEGEEAWLRPHERPHVEAATPKRRREFAAGRHCAHLALATLGVPDLDIGVGSHREPIWPRGVVGSITHTVGYCLAAVARGPTFERCGIGVDAEVLGRVGPVLFDTVLCDDELRRIDGLDDHHASNLATAFFCAKEAFYKAQFSLTRSWVGFGDLCVDFDGSQLRIDRTSDLPALDALCWPTHARVFGRGNIVAAAVTARAVAPIDTR